MGHPVPVFENQTLPTPDSVGTFQECVRNPTGRKGPGFSLGPEGTEAEQASDLLPPATLAWAGPGTGFLSGTASALTVGYGADFGALWQTGSWVLTTCALLRSHTLMVMTLNF